MEKDFDHWNELKKKINVEPTHLNFHERKIWFCYLGANIGTEEDGKGADFLRPVIIIKTFGRAGCFAIPLTRTARSGNYYAPLTVKGKTNTVLLEHFQYIDARRLLYKMGYASVEDFKRILESFIGLLKN